MIDGINDTSPASWAAPSGIIDRTRCFGTGPNRGWTTGMPQNAASRVVGTLEKGIYGVVSKIGGTPALGYAGGIYLGKFGDVHLLDVDPSRPNARPAPHGLGLVGCNPITPLDDGSVQLFRIEDYPALLKGETFRDLSGIFKPFGMMRHLGSQNINTRDITRTECMAPSGHDLSFSMSAPEAFNYGQRCGIGPQWLQLPDQITDKDADAVFAWSHKNAPAAKGHRWELSNEHHWNTMFPQWRRAADADVAYNQKATADAVAAGKKASDAQTVMVADHWVGTRLAQLTRIAKPYDVKFVLCSQFENIQRLNNVIAYFNAAGGDWSKIDAIAPAIYNDAWQNLPGGQLLDLAQRGDIAGGLQILEDYQSKLDAWLAPWTQKAKDLGVALDVYETHPLSNYPAENRYKDVAPGQQGAKLSVSDQQTVLAYQQTVARGPGIVPIWWKMRANAAAGGVRNMMWFNFNHQPSTGGGYWGLSDTQIWPVLTGQKPYVESDYIPQPAKPPVDTAPILAKIDEARKAVAAMG